MHKLSRNPLARLFTNSRNLVTTTCTSVWQLCNDSAERVHSSFQYVQFIHGSQGRHFHTFLVSFAEVVQARQLPEGHYTDIVTRLSRVPRPSRAPTQRAWLAGCCAMPWNMLVQPVGLLKGPPPISQFSPFHSVRLLTYLCSSSLSFENRVKRSTPTCAFQKVLAEYPPF